MVQHVPSAFGLCSISFRLFLGVFSSGGDERKEIQTRRLELVPKNRTFKMIPQTPPKTKTEQVDWGNVDGSHSTRVIDSDTGEAAKTCVCVSECVRERGTNMAASSLQGARECGTSSPVGRRPVLGRWSPSAAPFTSATSATSTKVKRPSFSPQQDGLSLLCSNASSVLMGCNMSGTPLEGSEFELCTGRLHFTFSCRCWAIPEVSRRRQNS